ncbi:MAG: uL15 family ribosomal protein [Candidatus Pacebacteria bacterium]|nr:uL15 family ribosomal protein [Candidatus Paceibacterota bacterium]
MQIHQLKKPDNRLSQKKKKRVGRGGKKGTYSGRGIKGQKSRAGAKIKPQVREMVLKFPKRRGIHFSAFKKSPMIVKLEDITKSFPEGGIITPKKLRKANLIKSAKSNYRPVKILGGTSLSKSYQVKNCLVSQKAREKIEKAGGKVEIKNR